MQTTRADRPATARQTLAPVLLSFAAVTAALLWYALRENGFNQPLVGCGRLETLLREF